MGLGGGGGMAGLMGRGFITHTSLPFLVAGYPYLNSGGGDNGGAGLLCFINGGGSGGNGGFLL